GRDATGTNGARAHRLARSRKKTMVLRASAPSFRMGEEFMIGTRVVAGLTVAFGLLGQAAFALDVPIPAKVGIVKPLKLAKLVSKNANGFPLPLPPDEDPTVLGAEVQFFD